MSKDKTVSFTAQEYVWIAHRVNRAKKGAEAIAAGTAIVKKKDEKILEHKDYKMICKLCPIFPEMAVIKGEEYEVTLIPKQVSYVRHLVEANTKHMKEYVLAEYTRRAQTDLKYLKYITGTKELIEMLKSLTEKVT